MEKTCADFLPTIGTYGLEDTELMMERFWLSKIPIASILALADPRSPGLDLEMFLITQGSVIDNYVFAFLEFFHFNLLQEGNELARGI
jgi:hypothetical protein